jgi:hypothetical protein
MTPKEAHVLGEQIRKQVESQSLSRGTAGKPGISWVSRSAAPTPSRVVLWVHGSLFLWSISYQRWEELWVGPGEDVFGWKFEMLALGANALRESQDGVALVSVRVAVAQDQVGAAVLGPELSKLVHLISRCELAPELIHELEQSWGGSTALNEAPFLQSQFEDGWAAHEPSERKEPCRCSRGIVHPFHFDMRGHCRCDSNATFHKPLLRSWLRT